MDGPGAGAVSSRLPIRAPAHTRSAARLRTSLCGNHGAARSLVSCPPRDRVSRPGHHGYRSAMSVMAWLLEGDPAIRWQVMRDLAAASPDDVAVERARVEHEGWGAQLLALEDADGLWAGGACFPASYTGGEPGQPWTATMHTLQTLQLLGLDPASESARRAIALVAENGRWEHEGQRYFDGEVEPCINGRTVETGAYFGVDVAAIVERLLGERLEDGGWNCEAENGSVRSSFDTTINVLDGLLEFERATGGSAEVRTARRGGEEYLLERGLFRRKSTGGCRRPGVPRLRVPVLLALRRAASARLLPAVGSRPGPPDGGGGRRRAIEATARRPLAARPHPSRSGPLRPRGRRGDAESLEHRPRASGSSSGGTARPDAFEGRVGSRRHLWDPPGWRLGPHRRGRPDAKLGSHIDLGRRGSRAGQLG